MQYDVSTPNEYLEALDEDWRKEKLMSIRKMILDYAPELDESIRNKMLNFGISENDDYFFYFECLKALCQLLCKKITTR